MKKRMAFTALCVFSFYISNASFTTAQTEANNYISAMRFKIDPRRNIITDNSGVIHIFLYEDGNLLVRGYPATATERDKFQVHLYVEHSNNTPYRLEYAGTYSPSLNIESNNALVAARPTPPVPIHFAILGPFTGTLQITLKNQATAGGNFNTVTSTTISIAKIIHVSIGSGLMYSSLKNPGNIRAVPLTGNDSTLVADDVHGRGMLTIMATFYPGGRANLYIPSKKFKDHFGFIVGTAIGAGSSNFRDLFLGGQYDFAAGGSIIGGLHYGRRQKLNGISYKDFVFGESKFTGSLEDKKYMDWDAGFFFGVQVDSRVFSQLFK